jgi:hypothetical protein
MLSELKPCEFVVEFVSGMPKSYAYKLVNSTTDECKTVCFLRGITLNYTAKQLVNFVVIRDMILNSGPYEVVMIHTGKKVKRKR